MARSIIELETELRTARDAQRTSEIKDLTFLLDYMRTGGINTGSYKRELRAARNRQSGRRNVAKLGTGRIGVGDEVVLPNGKTMIITRIGNGTVWRDVPDEPLRSCPIKMVRLADKAISKVMRRLEALQIAVRTQTTVLQGTTEWEQVDAARIELENALASSERVENSG